MTAAVARADTDRLEAARVDLGLSLDQLWIAYFGIGGNGTPDDVEGWLAGGPGIDDRDHDLLAAALNDEFSNRGLDHPSATRADSPPSCRWPQS